MGIDLSIEKSKTQMRKGILEICILSIIEQNKEAYASDILEALKQAEMIVEEGTVYPLLSRLKSDGLLDYVWRESSSGPPRKYYILSEDGKKFMQETIKSWNELSKSVDKIINKKQ